MFHASDSMLTAAPSVTTETLLPAISVYSEMDPARVEVTVAVPSEPPVGMSMATELPDTDAEAVFVVDPVF